MSKVFKERQISGNVFKENDDSKEIFIVKKGIVILKKGETKVSEITSGKIFGHENALSEQNRTISAQTKGFSLCTLYYANVNELAGDISLDLLKNLMKQGRKKLEQYQEQSFKLNNTSEQKLLNNLKMSKVSNELQSFEMNPHIQEKHSRSQSSHVQGRSLRNISQNNSFRTQNSELSQIFYLNFLKQKGQEQQQILKNNQEILKYVEKCSPKSSQAYLSAPLYQTTHQIQTTGLIITMGNQNQKIQLQNQQRQNQNVINQLQQNYISSQNQNGFNQVDQSNQQDSSEQIQMQQQSSKGDYQPTKGLYTHQGKRSITSCLIQGVGDQRKILFKKMQEARDIYNSSKTTAADQSWFVIKRLNTAAKAKQDFTELNLHQQSNAVSPNSFQGTQTNQKELCSFSKLMTKINNKNNCEEQGLQSPIKQRATLTSFIKLQKNGQITKKVFQSINNAQASQAKDNIANQIFKTLSQSQNKDGIQQKSNQLCNDKKEHDQQNSNLEDIAKIPNMTIGSQDEDEERNDFNLESRYTGKQNIIHQSKNTSIQYEPNNNLQNSIVPNNIISYTNIQNNNLNNNNTQISNSYLNQQLQEYKTQNSNTYSNQNNIQQNISQQNNNISMSNTQNIQNNNNNISMNNSQNNLIQNSNTQINSIQNYKQRNNNFKNLRYNNGNKQNNNMSNSDQINNLQYDVNQYLTINKRSNSFQNNTKQNSKGVQIASKNFLYSTANQKIEVIPQILFQRRPSSQISNSKTRIEKSNTSNIKQLLLNSSQISQQQKQSNSNMNAVPQSNLSNIDDLILSQRKSNPQIFNNTMLNQKLEESEEINQSPNSQKKIQAEKQFNCSTQELNNIELNSSRKVSFCGLSNSSGLTQLKRSHLNSPDIFKVSDFIQENQFQDGQFSKNRDSERVKQRNQESNSQEKRKQTNTQQNLKIKFRTNTSHGTRTLSNQNTKREITDAIS